jgi:hypothetical protein
VEPLAVPRALAARAARILMSMGIRLILSPVSDKPVSEFRVMKYLLSSAWLEVSSPENQMDYRVQIRASCNWM